MSAFISAHMSAHIFAYMGAYLPKLRPSHYGFSKNIGIRDAKPPASPQNTEFE